MAQRITYSGTVGRPKGITVTRYSAAETKARRAVIAEARAWRKMYCGACGCDCSICNAVSELERVEKADERREKR